jgi:hypothetical protein
VSLNEPARAKITHLGDVLRLSLLLQCTCRRCALTLRAVRASGRGMRRWCRRRRTLLVLVAILAVPFAVAWMACLVEVMVVPADARRS